MRLFLCGITSNEYVKISNLIDKTKDYVDGYVWCVDSNPNSDSTYQLLKDNKKEGEIVRHKWTNSHDFQANEWLFSGVFQDGDWCYIADSSEQPSEFWIQGMKRDVENYEQQGISAIYCSGRVFLFKWTEYLYHFLSPHWNLFGITGKTITIPEEQKDLFIINKRKLSPEIHFQSHDTKYYFSYARSNQIEAFYGKYGQKAVLYHESLRRLFRKELQNLGYRTTLPQLETYFKNGIFSDLAKNIIATEFCLSEYYRRVILNEDFLIDIVPKREKWSFLKFLENGDGFSDPNYLGTRLVYDKQ